MGNIITRSAAKTGKTKTTYMKFIIETGHNCVISGIYFPGTPIPIYKDFDAHQPIGKGRVFIEDGVLKCDAEIPDGFTHLSPAIQISVGADFSEQEVPIKSCTLKRVGLTALPLIDKSVLSLRDQERHNRRVESLQKWNRQKEEQRKAKAAFKLSINETILFPILNLIYRAIDWLKSLNKKNKIEPYTGPMPPINYNCRCKIIPVDEAKKTDNEEY